MSAEDHEIVLPGQAEPRPARRTERRADAGVAANARLTATNAAVLLALLAARASRSSGSASCSRRTCSSA